VKGEESVRLLAIIAWQNYNSSRTLNVVLESPEGVFNFDYPSLKV